MSNKTVLKIFTLNVWGLKFVSKHRTERIKLIAQHLNDNDYDVVFLQEVWVQSDFEHIRDKTKSKYKFVHSFRNASILGTSGLVVLVKWVPKVFHFHPFSVNGSPFQPTHGDWFTSKGIGYVRVELDAFNLHLFCTHMHAQYNLNERPNDQYSVHRICQSYEMAKFVELVTKNSSDRDFVILAGDMNASSREQPYRLLVGLTQLNDCFYFWNNSTKSAIQVGDDRIQDDSDVTDDEFHTCGHRDNKFKASEPSKRIDFILFRMFDKSHFCNKQLGKMCKVEHMTIACKDETGLSFSDHQPVVALFKLKGLINDTIDSKRGDNSDEELNDECIDQNIESLIEDSVSISSVGTGNRRRNCVNQLSMGDGSNGCGNLHDCGDGSCGDHRTALLTSKLRSNVLPELSDPNSRPVKSSHQRPTNGFARNNSNKLRPNRKQLLEETKTLLEDYLIENRLTVKYFIFVFIIFLMITSLTMSLLLVLVGMSTLDAFVSVLVLMVTTLFVAFLKFLSSRTETNAIKAILNEIEKDIERDPLLNFGMTFQSKQ